MPPPPSGHLLPPQVPSGEFKGSRSCLQTDLPPRARGCAVRCTQGTGAVNSDTAELMRPVSPGRLGRVTATACASRAVRAAHAPWWAVDRPPHADKALWERGPGVLCRRRHRSMWGTRGQTGRGRRLPREPASPLASCQVCRASVTAAHRSLLRLGSFTSCHRREWHRDRGQETRVRAQTGAVHLSVPAAAFERVSPAPVLLSVACTPPPTVACRHP